MKLFFHVILLIFLLTIIFVEFQFEKNAPKNLYNIVSIFLLLLPILHDEFVNEFKAKYDKEHGYKSNLNPILFLLIKYIDYIINNAVFLFENFLSRLSNYLKELTLINLFIIIYLSLFKVYNAELTKEITSILLLILLLSVIKELKNFDFLGIKGTRLEQNLESTKNIDAITNELPPNTDQKKVTEEISRQNDELTLMPKEEGNFLKLSFEIEKLLRISAGIILEEEINPTYSPKILAKKLKEKDLLTENGYKQVEYILEVRNKLVHGRTEEITSNVLNLAFDVAKSFYIELHSWLYPNKDNKSA